LLIIYNDIQAVKHRVHVNGEEIAIPSPTVTKTYPAQQPTMEVTNPVDLSSFGPKTRAPIGYVCHGRSGDKSSNVNIGLFVRHDDEWDWLRSLLTSEKMKELLRDEYTGTYMPLHGLSHTWYQAWSLDKPVSLILTLILVLVLGSDIDTNT
jgi:hypothetical protein